jgi:serine-type D-Ala-D-Ala carboxypeptidase/endopeptidase
MFVRRKLWVLFAFGLVLALTPARAAAPPLGKRGDLAAAEQAIFAATKARGMVAVLVRGDEIVIRGYGETAQGSGRKPDAQSLLRLNSISKLFVADLMTLVAQDGRLDLEDLLQRFAPDGVRVPAPITLRQLATHTSGLPRAPDLTGFGPSYAAAKWAWLARQSDLVPGRNAAYSNIAFDFLADAVARAAGAPYTQLLAQRILGPLGMHDTTPAPDEAQCARLLDGGTSLPCRDQSAFAGSGGLYATAGDMALWMRNQLAADRRAHALYVRPSDVVRFEGLDSAGPADGIGLGWLHLAADDTHPALLEKSGSGAGFISYVALAPEVNAGVFIATTRVDGELLHALARRANELVGLLAQ